jgi:hypothetical protein
MAPWLDFPTPPTNRDKHAEWLKSIGIDGAAYARRLTEVLESDPHLKECLGSTVLLADYIDRSLGYFFASYLNSNATFSGRAEKQWESFERETYKSELRRLAYTHLFNFQSDQERIDLGFARIEKLSGTQLTELLGGSPHALSFLHNESESEYFLVIEERGGIDGITEWMAEKRRVTLEIIAFLQFFKTGVVHATYTVYELVPNWVRHVYQRQTRRSLGAIRSRAYRDQRDPYFLDNAEIDSLKRTIQFMFHPPFRSRLENRKNGFRQMLFRAGGYYQSSLTREKSPERMVDLAIALESMLTPASARTELTFRISQNLAQLLGTDAARRMEISRAAKRLYEKRSALLHGQYDYEEYSRDEFVNENQIDEWSQLIRLAIVRLGVLFLRGQDNREELLNQLSEVSLNQELGDRIRAQGDPDTFLAELLGQGAGGAP